MFRSKPLLLPGRHVVNAGLMLLSAGVGVRYAMLHGGDPFAVGLPELLVMAAIAVNTDDGIPDCDATADDAPERNSSQVIAVIQIRDEHLKERLT